MFQVGFESQVGGDGGLGDVILANFICGLCVALENAGL